jgi:hypothetical protein
VEVELMFEKRKGRRLWCFRRHKRQDGKGCCLVGGTCIVRLLIIRRSKRGLCQQQTSQQEQAGRGGREGRRERESYRYCFILVGM